MKKQIIIEDIKDIQIDGYCIKKNNNCIHDIVIIYKNDIIKSTTLNFLDIKYILDYLNKKNSHFN